MIPTDATSEGEFSAKNNISKNCEPHGKKLPQQPKSGWGQRAVGK